MQHSQQTKTSLINQRWHCCEHDRHVRYPRNRRRSDGYHLDHFQQVVLLGKKSHLLVFDSASREKKVFSPTERWIEKCSVATHTQLGRISARNIWALGPLKNCGVLSPRLICSRGWKRSIGGGPLNRVGLWSFSKEFFFFFLSRPEGTTIEGSGREKERNI